MREPVTPEERQRRIEKFGRDIKWPLRIMIWCAILLVVLWLISRNKNSGDGPETEPKPRKPVPYALQS